MATCGAGYSLFGVSEQSCDSFQRRLHRELPIMQEVLHGPKKTRFVGALLSCFLEKAKH